ncbi:Protein kinase-like domain containing protein [Tylopilus felleus]
MALYGHKCLGVLFTVSSICRRGTTVFCAVDPQDEEKRLAFKLSWQDLARVAEQDAVMERLKSIRHRNVIVPLKTFKVDKNGERWTTLASIRDFLPEEIRELGVENRVLTISVSDLKRPVKYFWGVDDFVRGIRGALTGHQYLTEIGVLHRDISENNIVLGLRPEDERGYLIDFNMAILQDAEARTEPELTKRPLIPSKTPRNAFSTFSQHDDKTPVKALRTGTFPYMSYNILRGGRHTHFDDVESFLYVIFLFFFSYAGPLSVSELLEADQAGFVSSMGSGHGDAWTVGKLKLATIISPDVIESPEFARCLENNWPARLHAPIANLIQDSFTIFQDSTLHTRAKRSRTEVSHAKFISVLEKWLKEHVHLEEDCSNCPFKKPEAQNRDIVPAHDTELY